MRRLPIYVLASVLIVSGCTGSRTPDTGPSSPARTVADYPFVWLDTPHLDLNTPDGTFVRAIAESHHLRAELGPQAYFPGYYLATSRKFRWSDDLWAKLDAPHTSYMWVAPFFYPGPEGKYDWPTPSASIVGVAVCRFSPGSSDPEGGLFFVYSRQGQSPPSHLRGPRSSPHEAVFGDWIALRYVDATTSRRQRCKTPPRPLPTDVHRSSPGWPQ